MFVNNNGSMKFEIYMLVIQTPDLKTQRWVCGIDTIMFL